MTTEEKEFFDERAGQLEFDAGFTRLESEIIALQELKERNENTD